MSEKTYNMQVILQEGVLALYTEEVERRASVFSAGSGGDFSRQVSYIPG